MASDGTTNGESDGSNPTSDPHFCYRDLRKDSALARNGAQLGATWCAQEDRALRVQLVR